MYDDTQSQGLRQRVSPGSCFLFVHELQGLDAQGNCIVLLPFP